MTIQSDKQKGSTCDVLILGGGSAGLTAGIYAAHAGAKTILVENLAVGGQINLTPDITNFPGFIEIGGAELGEKMHAQAEHAGVQIIYDEIRKIDADKNTIEFNENTIQYKALIIATGAAPRKLGIEREEDFIGAGVHFCGLCDGTFFADKTVVVVGGGNHAVEEATYLSRIAKSVTIVNELEKFTAKHDVVSKMPSTVRTIMGAKVKQILGERKITGVVLSNETSVSCDGIFVAIGRVPNSADFRGIVDLAADGCIRVDANMRTSRHNIFAAGDVTNKAVKQVITACADGAIAATFATKI